MGQVISSFLRWWGGEAKTDGIDTNASLISHSQGPSYCINICPDNDTELPWSYSPPIIFPSTESHPVILQLRDAIHEMPFSDTDNRDMHSSVADNSSMLCSDQDAIYVEEEIKDVIMNNHNHKETMLEKVRRIGPYTSSQKMLLVGEGDFSFSASLAEAFMSAVNIVATSLDSQEFLRKNYKHAIGNISKLTERGATVLHGVDCTKMEDMFTSMRFDRIIYNFPHSGFNGRDEPRESQLHRHRTLVRLFLANAKKLVSKELGEIHITHKSKGFFLQWDLRSLASEEGLLLLEEVPFNRKEYPGYHNMCVFGGNQFFYCCPSKTYKFGLPHK